MVDSIKIAPYSEIQEDYYKRIFKGSAPVPVQLEKPDSGKETHGNLRPANSITSPENRSFIWMI
ncbi:MAG: hypothetical protein V8T87_00995 [Victivallales bacterium]